MNMKIGKDVNTARMLFEVTPEFRDTVKKRAKNSGVTIRQYIHESLVLRMELEDKKKVTFVKQE